MRVSRARRSSVVLRNLTKAAAAPGCLFLSGCSRMYIFFLDELLSSTLMFVRSGWLLLLASKYTIIVGSSLLEKLTWSMTVRQRCFQSHSCASVASLRSRSALILPSRARCNRACSNAALAFNALWRLRCSSARSTACASSCLRRSPCWSSSFVSSASVSARGFRPRVCLVLSCCLTFASARLVLLVAPP